MTVIKSQLQYFQITGNIITKIAPIGEYIDGTKNLENDEGLIDLSNYLLLPGFINAHCHLELTALGDLPYPGSFVKWIQKLVALKNDLSPEISRDGIKSGIAQLMQSGVSTVGDHISFNTDYSTIINSPLRGILFGEVLGVSPEMATDIYNHLKVLADIKKKQTLFSIHITPHAVHSVHPDTFRKVLTGEPAPLSCHMAESQTEDDYFKKQSGEMMNFIQSRGIKTMHQSSSGLMHVIDEKLPAEKLLMVHGNYFTNDELKIIKEKKISIVYCPGSHNYFGHKKFPLREILDLGINVALGTDSLASNTELNFLHEIQLTKQLHPEVSIEEILKMATINGAYALRMENEIGSIEVGKKADLVGFRMTDTSNPLNTLFKTQKADFLMINGVRIF